MMDLREILNSIKPYVLGWACQNGVWTPTFTGFSSAPTGVIARYVLTGNLCKLFVFMAGDGTSNANFFNITAPFVSANVAGMAWGGLWYTAVDNGAALTVPGRIYINANSNTIVLQKDAGTGAWTTSGGKRAHFQLDYEIN